MKIHILLCFWSLFAAVAHADWAADYQRFQAALERGDLEAAEAAARDAWQSGREELKPSDDLALLAQNYADFVVFTDPEAAIAVLEEAVSLAEQGYGTDATSLPTLTFMLAETRSAAFPKHRKHVLAAVEALRSVPGSEGLVSTVLSQRMRLALTLRGQLQFAEMGEVAGDLSDELAKVTAVSPKLELQAEMLRASALLNSQPRRDISATRTKIAGNRKEHRFEAYAESLERSKQRFRAIGSKFPPQASIEAFDPVFADVLAWHAIMRTFQASYSEEASDFPPEKPSRKTPSMASQLACDQEITWYRRGLRFPRASAGYNGAVVLGFHLDEEGSVTGARVLSEMPEREKFGKAVLGQVKRWQADVEGLPEACLRDRLVTFQFATLASGG